MHVKRLMRRIISLLLAGVLTGPAVAQQAQVLLDLTTDRELTLDELELLSKILVQNDFEAASRAPDPDTILISEICGSQACRNVVFAELQRANDSATIASASRPPRLDRSESAAPSELFGWTGNVLVPGRITDDGQDYLVRKMARDPSGPELIEVPLQSLPILLGHDSANTVTTLVLPNSVPTQLIESDLGRLGMSRRTFAFRRDLPEGAVSAALAQLRAAGLGAVALSEDAEQPASLIEPLDVVIFEGEEGSTGNCGTDAAGKPWPFDPQELIQILEFNLRVMDMLSLPIRRSVVVVADTGIGENLVRKDAGPLATMLAANTAELLRPHLVFNRNNSLPNATSCMDNDGNGYYGDIFGAVGSELNRSNFCSANATEPAFDARLFPVDRRPGAVETYEPAHGSFVATLAVGGPDLIEAYPAIARQIGLQIFRTTRPTEEGSTKSVRVEPADITGAIKYAVGQHATVLNMSMKVTDRNLINLFKDVVGPSDTLIVASAGNLAEKLDVTDSGVYPAGIINKNLIVVGGLSNDGERSWWQSSATGVKHVNIAAPAVGVKSVNAEGQAVCYSGTSAAAPLVSFTAAALLSYGVFTPEEARNRVLSTAEIDRIDDPARSLSGHVMNAKKLDVAAALDIFLDRIKLTGEAEVLRGQIVADPDLRLIQVCDPSSPDLAGLGGLTDPAKLRSWHRGGEVAWYELSTSEDIMAQCKVPGNGEVQFRQFGQAEIMPLRFDTIDSMVLSPFRSREVEAAVLRLTP